MCAQLLSHIWLRGPMDSILSGSSDHGIFQVRILEWVAIFSSRWSFWPRDPIYLSYHLHRSGEFFSTESPDKPIISSVQFSCSVLSDSATLWLQHARPPCPSPVLRVYSNSCPLSRWCHPTISSSVVSFSSHLQSFPSSGAFQMSQFFACDGQSIAVSALQNSVLQNIQDWLPLWWTGWTSLQSKRLSRVFSNTTVQKYQFFSTQLSL